MPTPVPLAASRLHATFDPARIPWSDTSVIPAGRQGRAGRSPFQPRAMQALDLALQIKVAGYHVYLSGEANLGRSHMLLSYLAPRARQLETPPDLVHVCNFSEPDAPMLISLPAGVGKKLRNGMQELLENIGEDLEQRFESIAFLKQKTRLVNQFQDARADLVRRMSNIARSKGFNLEMDGEGSVTLSPLYKGKKLNEADFGDLDPDLRMDFRNRGDRLVKNLSAYIRKLGKAEESLKEHERGLDELAMSQTLDALLAPFAKRFLKLCQDNERLNKYFTDLREDILKNTEAFLPSDPRKEELHQDNFLNRYAVNLFVDNSDLRGAPVIVEDNPTETNLLGCMERESEMGALITDVALIRSGSLQRANGGFLILHAEDILSHSAAWEGLLRSLRAEQARIEDEVPEGGPRAKTLRPEPLKLNLKVILIGCEDIYEAMLEHDDRFAKLFRIKAHMTDVTERNAANVRLYLGEIAQIARNAELMPFDATALAWLVDLGSHLCEDQKRLSLKFPLLREMMIEANALAQMGSQNVVTASILEEAWAAKAYRVNLVEEVFMEEYDREMIKVCTSGSAVGQVNGLSVTWNGDFEFGLPHRISCTVGVGNEGIIDLEREAELGGPIHTKAMMIIKSYLTDLFADKKPLVLSASLYFEQSYAGIEGDSASGAELAALISALANVPVRLDLAFTGAVSHSGQIMAVGGVTRKIEGFYKVCARHGLTGTQGVIIPHDNVDHLMLSPEILDSVEHKRFAIYPVRNMEEALQLLTGLPAGKKRKNGSFTPQSLFDLADRRLESLGSYAQNAFRRARKERDAQ